MSNLKKIKFFEKKIINNHKGNVMKFIKKNDKNYTNFGEVYFTWIKKNYLKGWKFHKKMHMNLTVPVGKIKCLFYDKRLNKKKIFNLSEKKFGTLYVPPKIWFAFRNMDKKKIVYWLIFQTLFMIKEKLLTKILIIYR